MRDTSKKAGQARRMARVSNPIKVAPIVAVGEDAEGNTRYSRGSDIYNPAKVVETAHVSKSKYNADGSKK